MINNIIGFLYDVGDCEIVFFDSILIDELSLNLVDFISFSPSVSLKSDLYTCLLSGDGSCGFELKELDFVIDSLLS